MTFLYTLIRATRKQKDKRNFFLKCIAKSNVIKKNFGVLVFSFMYLVSVDPMDWSKVPKIQIKHTILPVLVKYLELSKLSSKALLLTQIDGLKRTRFEILWSHDAFHGYLHTKLCNSLQKQWIYWNVFQKI